MYLNGQKPVTNPNHLTGYLGLIPSGAEGVRATLHIMRALTRAYKKFPTVRDYAARIVQALPQKDFVGEIKRLFEYVRDSIRYVRDTTNVETVQTPDKTLQLGYGDCDDKSVLLATFLESIGHPTRFVALAVKNPEQYEHVIVETLIGKKWIPLDATEPQPFGWYPANVKSRMVVHN